DEKTLPCYDRFRCAGGLFRGGRGHVRAAGLRRPRPSIAGPASIGVGTSAIAGANRETTTLLGLATVAGKSDSQRHLGRSAQYLFTRPRRYAPDSALPFYLRSNSAKVLPKRAGDGETLMPAASMAAILLSASPLPPEMMAPAWPIRRPGGAVRPAMNPTIGFLRPRLASSVRNWAASSSAEPPISPIITIASVA